VKVLFAGGGTGGHLMPAVALAEVLGAERPDAEAVFVGAQRGIEAQVLPHLPYRYHLLPLEPIYRRAWWRNLRWPVAGVRAWRAVGRVLDVERPVVVVGTGGYASGPVVWRAQRRGLPTALQEQNSFPGIATRLLARGARQVHLGFPEARTRLRPGRDTAVFDFGNPIRPPEPGARADALAEFGLDPARRTLLAFGGSQGARALNEALAAALAAGAFADVNVLWGTGTSHVAAYERYATAGRIAVRGFFDPMAAAYRAADLVVCRAGAMTTAELCAWGKPSVLVPLPTATADHQTRNALTLAAAGAAVHLAERDMTGDNLVRLVGDLLAHPDRLAALAEAARGRGRPDAARAIVSKILTLAE
jgi:UDP-N-acetylglucosamine--N-acetylmuramyl-(pentapeptide) pyrophosphoryl-undecaprenol N-acetylglucosamine transferase